MELDVRMNMEELIESEMEIEKNREEVLAFIRSWVEEVRELVFAWISEGNNRSKCAGNDIEIKLGVLGSCLEVVMEEIQEEQSDKYDQRMSEMVNHKFKVDCWTFSVRKNLKEIEKEPLGLEKEADSDRIIISELRGDFNSDKEESLDGRSGAKTNEADSDRIIISELEFEAAGKEELKVGIDMRSVLQIDGEKRLEGIAMARTKKPEIGGELGLDLDQLGPPPWSRGVKKESVEDDQRDGGSLEASMEDLEVEEIDSNESLPGEGLVSKVRHALSPSSGEESTEHSDVESEVDADDKLKADQSDTNLAMDDTRPIDGCSCERVNGKIARTMQEKRAVDLNTVVQGVEESNAALDMRLHREELEINFEKMVTMAAREVQATEAIWMVGLKLQEPVFLLVMGMAKFGCESELTPKPIGLPPWFDGGSKKWEMDYKQIGLSLTHLGPSYWPNSNFSSISRQFSQGPKEGKYDERDNSLRRPPESSLFQARQCRSIEPRPTARPPPDPLDPLSKLLRLMLTSIVFVCPVDSYPISVGINGKVDADGDDPDDSRFHQFLVSLEFASAFKNSLEDKACLKRSARTVGNQVEGEGFVLPPPAEPPPQPPAERVSKHTNTTDSILLQLSGKKEASSIDPGDIPFQEIKEEAWSDPLLKQHCSSNRLHPPPFVPNQISLGQCNFFL